MSDFIVETIDLHKSYFTGHAPDEVLKGVNFRVKPGEFVAVMGPSGCGKSTLLHLLGALDRPTSGHVLIDGHDLDGLTPRERTVLRRDRVGFVFQRFNLLGTLSAEQNLLISLRIRSNGKPLRARVDELLESVGLSAKKRLRPGQLSIGEQQRVAIARAVLHSPAVLLADEPTGNLDSTNAARVLDLLCRLNRDAGQTVILVTHNEEAAGRASRIVHMRDGVLLDETAVPGELI
jgi:putative ABC transport system ATP-binding protein